MSFSMNGFRRIVGVAGLLSVALVGSACSGGDSPTAGVTTVSAARDLDLTSAPVLSGMKVLTVKGKGVDGRFPGGLALDIAALERLRVVDAVTQDPWEKRTITYRGVLMSDLLDAIAPSGATAMRFTALDDYEVTLPMKDLQGDDALLATSIAGKRIAIKDGGPIRIVFLPKSTAGRNKDLWIWSITKMTAK